MDWAVYRYRLRDNALVAIVDLLLPLVPGSEAMVDLERTVGREISPHRRHINVDVLALVPNTLNGRTDQQTQDRQLLQRKFNQRVHQNIVVRGMTDALLRTVVKKGLVEEVTERFEQARSVCSEPEQ